MESQAHPQTRDHTLTLSRELHIPREGMPRMNGKSFDNAESQKQSIEGGADFSLEKFALFFILMYNPP
jgi:hypothetical protein